MPTTEEKLKTLFARQLNVEPSALSADSSPATIGTWDSLKHVELILAIEDAFAIAFEAAEVFGLTSFGGIHAMLNEKLGTAPTIVP